MPELLSHPYCTVVQDSVRAILRFTRTDLPYASLGDIGEVHGHIGRIFDRVGRERHGLLVDMRRAPLNNHAEFEQAAARGRRVMLRGFRRVAVLVQTAVGALQVKRHVREDNIPGDVFTEEAPAIEYLGRTDVDAGPSSGVGLVKAGPFNHLARLSDRR
jgi:hypothetical protein